MTRDDGSAGRDVADMQAEIEGLLAGVDANERELSCVRDAIAARRDECQRLESDAESVLLRLLNVAERTGNDELRSVARRELAAIAAEI